jgi:hypothetical protein
MDSNVLFIQFFADQRTADGQNFSAGRLTGFCKHDV